MKVATENSQTIVTNVSLASGLSENIRLGMFS